MPRATPEAEPAPAQKPNPVPRPAPSPAPAPRVPWWKRLLPVGLGGTRDSEPTEIDAAKKEQPKEPRREPKQEAARKRPPRPDDDECLLVSTGGGFTWSHPGKCYYECSDGKQICKLVQGYQVPCPGAAAWKSPFSEIRDLEDCP